MNSFINKDLIINNFPNLKLSYETIGHNKVYNYELLIAIPMGKKCYAWFTNFDNKNVCIILETKHTDLKKIIDVKIVNAKFSHTICTGTIVFGTLFHVSGNMFFSIEDILMLKGDVIYNTALIDKYDIICNVFIKHIEQVAYDKTYIVFGLPIMSDTDTDLQHKLSNVNYKIYSIKYICNKSTVILPFYKFIQSDYTNLTNKMPLNIFPPSNNHQYINNKQCNNNQLKNKYNAVSNNNKIFICKPDVQNDIYHLYSLENNYIGLANVPDYNTSVMLNNVFRIIKENSNLDALEESDDESEFENSNINKYVYIDKSVKVLCEYNNKFKKWKPIKIIG